MKGMDVIEALGEIREDWLEDAAPKGTRKPPQWIKYLSLAACLVLLAGFSGLTLTRVLHGEAGQNAAQPPAEQASIPAAMPEDSAEEDSEREIFFQRFYQLDQNSVLDYAAAHPECLERGWSGVDLTPEALNASERQITTIQGDPVLALDAENGILLVRVEADDSQGVLAICQDTSGLRLCAAETLPDSGETVGTICESSGGLLAITGSAFVDDGTSDGGTLSGLAVCQGTVLGSSLAQPGVKRLELRADNRMYLVDSTDPVGEDTRDACEFQPALIVDGEDVTDDTSWTGPNPRAAIGQTDRLETMLIVVEGRLWNSPGCGVEAVAEKLLEYNCVQAMNLDGGTSAIMYYKGSYLTRCSNTALPQGRKMPTAWVYG